MKKEKLIQVNLRLPTELKEKIHEKANQNGCSLNAQLNAYLEKAVTEESNQLSDAKQILEDLLTEYQSSPRQQIVAERLKHLLSMTNEASSTEDLTPSEVAFEIGKIQAKEVELWFLGKKEPSFDELKQLAAYFGCDEDWLLFGKKVPYPSQDFKDYQSLEVMSGFCTQPSKKEKKLRGIYFVRKESVTGELLIIKHFQEWRCEVYKTNIHISEMVGDTGKNTRAITSLVMYALHLSDWGIRSSSFIVSDEGFLL